MPKSFRGFGLAEVILALGLLAVAIMSIMGLSISALRTDSKAMETSAGRLIADQVVKRLGDQLRADTTIRGDFLSGEFVGPPWDKGTITNNHTVFNYQVFASTVRDAAGKPLGWEAEGNRLKKVDVEVWWTDETDRARQGYGRLEVRTTQLISEAALASLEEEP